MITDTRADDVVSADVGLVHRIDEGVAGYDHPRLAPAYAQACDTRSIFGVGHDARAGGLAADPASARAAALGEALERYSACHVPRSRLRRAASPGPVAEPTVPPDWLDPTADHPPVHYVPGWRLRRGAVAERAWVAASRAYLDPVDGVDGIALPTSTGLACHPDPWRALRSGLLEVIERDAVMISWLTMRAARPITCGLSWRARSGARLRFDRAVERYRLHLLDSPVGVPVVFCVAFGSDGQPAAAVGAAAHLDVAAACRRALVEANQTFQLAAHMLARGRRAADTVDEVLELDDHVAYYLGRDRLSAFDFLTDATAPPVEVDLAAADDEGNPRRDVLTLLDRLADAELDCYAVDVTSPDVREAERWVIRTVVPGLYPLTVGTTVHRRHPRLAGDRPVNPNPHPFP